MIDDRENFAENEQMPTLPKEDAFLLLEQERRELELEEQKMEQEKMQEQSRSKKKAGTKPSKQRQSWNTSQQQIDTPLFSHQSAFVDSAG